MSPFWLDWRIILAVFILLNIQWFILGGCYLSFLESGWKKDSNFWHYYLSKIWPNLNKKRVRIVTEYVLPPLLVLFACWIQIKIGWDPFLTF